MYLAIDTYLLFNIIHLGCYILALIPSMFVAMAIDITKFIKPRSNATFHAFTILVTIAFTFLTGEFLYNILTMFIR